MIDQRAQDSDKPLPLPAQLTTFIGRRQELADVERMLADEACRLLTLVGVGGVGKTRLAIEAAGRAQARFGDGVAFVTLQEVESAVYLAPAISGALNMTYRDTEDPWQQLLSQLCERETLLVLDNFEHLLDAAPRLTTLLQAAPEVTLLVTSREALRLEEEWRYPLHGLPAPDGAQASDWETHDALRLFADRARRVRPDFTVADELPGAIRLCRVVGGMPLAIEMAASWLKTATCEQIAEEIENNLDLLTTTMRNVARRHRSLRAVFEHSWQRLSEEERQTFARLSVFRGSFRRQAAADVAGATLLLLSSLVDKSLLRWEPDGSYQMHTLLRQYAAEQLEEAPQVRDAAHAAHGRYYANFLEARRADLHRRRQRKALSEIDAELGNIRAAWSWAVGRRDVEKMGQAGEPLAIFYDFRGRYVEGVRALQAAVDALEEGEQTPHVERTMAMLLSNLGGLLIRVGRLDETETVLERCRTLFERAGQSEAVSYHSDPLLMQGVVASIRGDFEGTERLGRQALRESKALKRPLRVQAAHYLLARAALLQGRVQDAARHIQKSYELGREEGDRWFLAYSLLELGNVACLQGRYEQAKGYFQESLSIRQEFEDPEGAAVALNHLGKVALRQGETTDARALFEQALTISREISNHGGSATALGGLGAAALAEKDFRAAQRYLNQALVIACQFQFVSLLLSLLVSAGELLAQLGHEERGLQLLVVARQHSRSEHETREQARQALSRTGSQARQALKAPENAATEWETLAQLARSLESVAIDESADETDRQMGGPELVEPLTEREAEVLQLLAEGLSNAQIARRLVLAIGTVKYYTSEIYGKLGVNGRVQAVNRARELRLL